MKRVVVAGPMLAVLLVLSNHVALGQEIGRAVDYVHWKTDAGAVAPGGIAHIRLDATIADGWKMYALNSPPPSRGAKIEFDDVPEGFALKGSLLQSKPREHFDPNFKIQVLFFKETAQFAAAFKVSPTAPKSTQIVNGTVDFQICNDDLGVCLPPTTVPFSARISVDPVCAAEDAPAKCGTAIASLNAPTGEAQISGQQGTTLSAGGASIDVGAFVDSTEMDWSSRGFWGFLLLAFGAGLAALLTPCVFPMVPLTVSFFTHHSENRREAFRMASVYGLSIVVTFSGLGVLLAVVEGAAGAQSIASNPWVNLFIGAVLIIFALSLLGLFELRLPIGVLNFFNRQGSERSGYLGVIFMGLTLTLVSFSCTAPFVGGLLAVASGGMWLFPLIGMIVFSTAFALPFILLALFPKALNALPASGSWMTAIKVVLGFVELAASIKFLSNADLVWQWGLISRTLAIAFVSVIFLLTGVYLLGKLPLHHEPAPERVGVGRLLTAIAFIGLSLFMLPGLLGAPLNALDAYLPPRKGNDVSLLASFTSGRTVAQEEAAWHTDNREAAFSKAVSAGKPVLVDFSGWTCTNCREMETNVFPNPGVAQRFDTDFVLLRLYTDDLQHGQAFQAYQLDLTGTSALPTYAIVDPKRNRLISKTSGISNVEKFIAFLDRGKSKFTQRNLALGR